MSDCAFCKIVAGEIPAAELVADDTAYAFLDISPLAEGHTLLIPRQHYETVDELPEEIASAMLKHIPVLVKAVKTATGCEGVNVLQNNGRVAHQFVPHVHFHIIPRYQQDDFQFNWPAGSYSENRMTQVQTSIREYL